MELLKVIGNEIADSSIGQTTKKAYNSSENVVIETGNNLNEGVNNIINSIKETYDSTENAIEETGKNISNKLFEGVDSVKNGIDSAKQYIEEKRENTSNSAFGKAIRNSVQANFELTKEIGKNLIDNTVTRAGVNVGEKAMEVAEQTGKNLNQGIDNGINSVKGAYNSTEEYFDHKLEDANKYVDDKVNDFAKSDIVVADSKAAQANNELAKTLFDSQDNKKIETQKEKLLIEKKEIPKPSMKKIFKSNFRENDFVSGRNHLKDQVALKLVQGYGFKDIESFQKSIGTKPDGKFGDDTFEKYFNKYVHLDK